MNLSFAYMIFEPILPLLYLLIAFQAKHWLCDFFLQNEFMLGKFKSGWDFVLPLLCHCAVHMVGTFSIVYVALAGSSVQLKLAMLASVFDLVVHFIMDRIKASPRLMGRWKALDAKSFEETQTCRRNSESYWQRYAAERELKSNRKYWLAIGFDQAVHNLTHYAIIFVTFILMP